MSDSGGIVRHSIVRGARASTPADRWECELYPLARLSEHNYPRLRRKAKTQFL